MNSYPKLNYKFHKEKFSQRSHKIKNKNQTFVNLVIILFVLPVLKYKLNKNDNSTIYIMNFKQYFTLHKKHLLYDESEHHCIFD